MVFMCQYVLKLRTGRHQLCTYNYFSVGCSDPVTEEFSEVVCVIYISAADIFSLGANA